MGKINELLCDYLGRPEYYADFWNGTEFGGNPRIQSSLLIRHDREYHKSQQKPIPISGTRRDVQMQYCDKNKFILGIEVMETVEYTMPVRIMDYDAQEFQRQLKDIRSKHEEAVKNGLEAWESAGEYLYKVKKEDKMIPVHTVALYCGTEKYDGGESILDMTEYAKFPSDLKGIFQNYSIKIYQLRDLIEENYQTSLREIIAVFKRCQNREAIKNYYLEHKERFQQLDELSIDTMGALIGNGKLKLFKQEEGGLDMCKAFEDERLEGRLEGERIGIARGEENLRQAINNLMKNLKLTSIQAMEALGIPQSEWEKYKSV